MGLSSLLRGAACVIAAAVLVSACATGALVHDPGGGGDDPGGAPGTGCTTHGVCEPQGASCPVGDNGEPVVVCGSAGDCAGCDAMHQVCDPATSRCSACSASDTSACGVNDVCVEGACAPRCPADCATDDDCGGCGAGAHALHACNAGQCTQCSDTYACPAGEVCGADGSCVPKCGQDGAGSCFEDADCASCGDGATACQKEPGAPGHCG